MSKTNMRKELADLQKMAAKDLRAKYRELFGDDSRSGNRQWLFRRCVWRLQALAEGGLSDRARQRAMEIANDADVRSIPPRPVVPDKTMLQQTRPTDIKADDRLPMVNTVLTRKFKRRVHTVTVLPNGFEYDGQIYKSLTAVAKIITGSHWNGYHFFKKSLLHTKQLRETA
ncbi:MAG: DUF2924 domain-containing protein [Actinobacteria bacterium]|nr:DUF2924 domain-containing protein [Actinomycetota bacterium]